MDEVKKSPFLEYLQQHRVSLLESYLKAVLGAYPEEAAQFMMKGGDPFRNPVGIRLKKAITTVFDQLIGAIDEEVVGEAIEEVMRIMAVQDFSAAEAVHIFDTITSIIDFDAYLESRDWQEFWQDYRVFERRLKQIRNLAINSYLACREKVYEVRASQARHLAYKAIERMNLFSDDS